MEILDQYNKSLNTYLVNYERYLRKHVPFESRLEYVRDMFSTVNEKESYPYSHFKVKLTYRDKEKSEHVYTSIISKEETETPIIDTFDINYTYKDKSGQECSVNFADVMEKNLKDLYNLFNMKSKDFEQCYMSKFNKKTKRSELYDYWGSSDIDVEISGFFLSDEFGTILATEDGTLLAYE